MNLLYRHLRKHARLVFQALFCAGANQLLLLLDPLILRRIIDGYALQARRLDVATFFRHVGLLLVAAIAATFLAWLAKNYQVDFVNRVARRVGMAIYSEGIGHSLGMPYSAFEDQRSGEIMGKLQTAATTWSASSYRPSIRSSVPSLESHSWSSTRLACTGL